MAIVLPQLRKKRIDIFAPRKSVQDAKEKLGPAYFDPSLLECSRNAIELNKLVNKWEDIDKEKVKFMRELTREQNVIARSYKKNRMSKKDENVPVTAEDCIETVDGKPIPPGFRFRSNGELKPSLMSLPHVSVSVSGEDVASNSSQEKLKTTDSKSEAIELQKKRSTYGAIDYSKEIDTLRGVIIDLCEELSKSKININKSHSRNFKSYLRGHTSEHKSITNAVGDLYRNPNDRFAFQPGSSATNGIHKQSLKTPSSRVCVGCQFKLRQQNEELQKLKVKQDKDILKRRWSYVPTGKYVQSSTALSSSISLHNSSLTESQSEDEVDTIPSRTPLVQFMPDSEINLRTDIPITKKSSQRKSIQRCSKSAHQVNPKARLARKVASSPMFSRATTAAPDSDITAARSLHSSLSKRSGLKSGSSMTSNTYCIGRSLGSSLSCRSVKSPERATSRLLADFDSRLNLLKEFETEHKKDCDVRIKTFLKDLDTLQQNGT